MNINLILCTGPPRVWHAGGRYSLYNSRDTRYQKKVISRVCCDLVDTVSVKQCVGKSCAEHVFWVALCTRTSQKHHLLSRLEHLDCLEGLAPFLPFSPGKLMLIMLSFRSHRGTPSPQSALCIPLPTPSVAPPCR